MALDDVVEAMVIRTIRLSPTESLLEIRRLIDAEMARRDVCEHGVATGDWCEPCNREYKRAAREHYGEGEGA